MSLRAAVEEVLADMEKEWKDLQGKDASEAIACRMVLSVYSKMLKIALKANEGEPVLNQGKYTDEAKVSAAALAKDREERLARMADKEERQAYCVGGSEDGVCWGVPSDMPFGAKVKLGNEGNVYKLGKDNQLHFDLTATQSLASSLPDNTLEAKRVLTS